MRTSIGTAIIVLAVGMSGPALAKKARHHAQDQATTQSARVPGVCRPLCTADMTPCDPPEFKNADGRCNFGLYGGGGSFN